jgi:MFS family permease
MLNAYRKLFTAPGSTGFVLAGLLARLPLSMTGIGLITMLSQQRGAYTLAGMVSACFALSIAVLAPRISALVDRYGQFRVLPFAAASSALSMLALLACAHWQGPDWLLLVLAAAVGSLPSMPAMVAPAGRQSTVERLSCRPRLHWKACSTIWPLSSARRCRWASACCCSPRPARWLQRCSSSSA